MQIFKITLVSRGSHIKGANVKNKWQSGSVFSGIVSTRKEMPRFSLARGRPDYLFVNKNGGEWGWGSRLGNTNTILKGP